LKFKLIVFDLDGTLVDTIPDISDVFNQILKSRGFNGHPAADYCNYVGWGLRRTLELVLPEGVPDKLFDTMLTEVLDAYAKRPSRLSRIYTGVSDLLNYIISKNIPMIVYTNKAQTIAQSVIDDFFPGVPFVSILGKTENSLSKPNPSALFAYLNGEKFDESHILMVGDTPIDLETARNAGIFFAGASWGFRSRDVLEEAGSTYNFSGAVELCQWLMN
jgi:phosphoglycolate phosphatase